MRAALTTAIELLGAAAIAAGTALIYIPAAYIVAGLLLIGIGYLLGRDPEVTP